MCVHPVKRYNSWCRSQLEKKVSNRLKEMKSSRPSVSGSDYKWCHSDLSQEEQAWVTYVAYQSAPVDKAPLLISVTAMVISLFAFQTTVVNTVLVAIVALLAIVLATYEAVVFPYLRKVDLAVRGVISHRNGGQFPY